MWKIVLAAVLVPLGAYAAPPVGTGVSSTGACQANGAACLDTLGNLSANSVLATDGTSSRTEAARPADVYNVMDHGAKCDDTTDDAAAINATTALARATSTGELDQPFQIVFPSKLRCLIKSSLNFTGFSLPGSSVVGGFIDCQTSGTTCIDALGSRFIRWNLTVYGNPTNSPTTGVQIGRLTAGSADDFDFDNARFTGYFAPNSGTQTLPYGACVYNFASEQVVHKNLYCYNRATAATAFGIVEDGYNHWNATSAFGTQTLPLDTRQSMIGVSFLGGQILSSNAGSAMWIGGTRAFTMDDATYVAAVNSTTNVITLYDEDASGNEGMKFDIHVEPGTVANTFLLSGTYAIPVLTGFQYREGRFLQTNAAFALDTGVTSATFTGANITIADMPGGSAKLFDNAALWTGAGGTINLPNLANWNEPQNFTGVLCIAGSCVDYVPTTVINRNPDFSIDQVQAGGSTQPSGNNNFLIDGWHSRVGGAVTNPLSFSQSTTSPPTGYSYSYSMIAPSAYTIPTGAHYGIDSAIEGNDFAQMSFGNSKAQPFTFDYCAKATAAPFVISAFFQNNGRSQSYVVNNTITTASSWQCFSNIIPGDIGGTWTVTRNHIGLLFGFDLMTGSTYQTTAGVWQSGEYYGTSSGTSLSATAGVSFNVAAVHIHPGQFHLPYLARSYADELRLAQRWYAKSFMQAVKPIQNGGAVGAATVINPVSNAAVSIPVKFPETMFTNNDTQVPTMTLFSTGAATANCYDTTRAADVGAASAVNTGDSAFSLSCAAATNAAADQIQAQWTADSGF